MNTAQPFSHASPLAAGDVSLVGAGPGDPDLLTLKALRRLAEADVVLYDLLVSPDILALANRQAELVCVGKRASRHTLPQAAIHELMVSHARQGRRVVRLKGGDPLLFGRGGEELTALAAEGIRCEVVPGISAALGAAASCGIPLTHRDCAQGVTLVTGHRREGELALDWTHRTDCSETVVVYMGLGEAAAIAGSLMEHGRLPGTPVAVVENATTPQQRVCCTTLAGLADTVQRQQIAPPALLLIGEVVRLYPLLAPALRRETAPQPARAAGQG